MELMELRRGLLMQGGSLQQALRSHNLVYGLDFYPGYLGSDGLVNNPGSQTKEVVSDFLPNMLSRNDRYVAVAEFPDLQSTSGWCAVCFYDNNKTHRTRNILGTTNYTIDDKAFAYFAPIIPNYDDGYIRISFRTYGNVNLYFVPLIGLLSDVFNPYNISGHVTQE